MLVKLFLLGGPGSGKSTVARCIEALARDKGWSSRRMNDYTILREMFERDQQRNEGRFKPAHARHGGFDVLDFTVVDEALRELEKRTVFQVSDEPKPQLVLIEFARNDYQQALQQFSQEFLRDAYFVYLSADREVCKQRVKSRVANPQSEDDHYVSDYIFAAYYNHDDSQRLVDILTVYGVDEQQIQVIKNDGALQSITPRIAEFVGHILCGKSLGVYHQ